MMQAYVLRAEDRYEEAEAAYRHLLETHPASPAIYNQLAVCALQLGHPDQAVPWLRKALELDPADTGLTNQQLMGQALLLMRQDSEAIDYLRRGIEIGRSEYGPWLHGFLAAAYAHTGRDAEARRELAKLLESRPFLTVRFLSHERRRNADLTRQWGWVIDGYARAGMRDHAEEDADSGLPTTTGLRTANMLSPTPTGAPNVTTIRTPELKEMVDSPDATARPLILVTALPIPDFTIPGALAVPGAYGNSTDKSAQDLEPKIDNLAHGDRDRPIVTASWNSERWSSRNLAIRLVALGYRKVYWYRGGLEAWDLAGLPEQPVRD
jgi:tetratricopeptide (TPR) repeat protein